MGKWLVCRNGILCVRLLIVLFFALFMLHVQPEIVNAFHESGTCIISVQVVSTKEYFQIISETEPLACQVEAQLNTDGWVQLNYRKYTVMIQLPKDVTDGWLTYDAGRGYAEYLDNQGNRKIPAFIFLRGWV